MELEETICEIFKAKKIKTGGNCGTYAAAMCYDLDISFQDVKPILEKLEAEGKIFYRIGVAGRLIFWNNKRATKPLVFINTLPVVLHCR